MTDHFSRFTARDVASWCAPSIRPEMERKEAVIAFHSLSPKLRFVKTLPAGASMLDAGAGAGAMILFKLWPDPPRGDLRMFAWAGDKGEFFDRFEASEVGWWPQDPPDFDGRLFDAVTCVNFVEHIDDPHTFVQFCAKRLNPHGRIFLEWPRQESIDLPSTEELRAVGVNVMTGRYHDDATHRPKPPLMSDVVETLSRSGLIIVERGISRVPMVDQQMAIHARLDNNLVDLTLAYWSFTEWCQFVVAEARD